MPVGIVSFYVLGLHLIPLILFNRALSFLSGVQRAPKFSCSNRRQTFDLFNHTSSCARDSTAVRRTVGHVQTFRTPHEGHADEGSALRWNPLFRRLHASQG